MKGGDKKPRNLGRAYLIEALQKRGLSRRRAKPILDFIFEEMTQELARDEALEIPFGWLKRE
jgi:nucleoid DNA-binding protein